MLPLYGIASAMDGFDPGTPRHVVRLRGPDRKPDHAADAALIRTPGDIEAARSSGFDTAVVIGGAGPDGKALPVLLAYRTSSPTLPMATYSAFILPTNAFARCTGAILRTIRSL